MDAAHNVASLLEQVANRKYDLFFIAPGMCNVFGEQGIEEVTLKIKEMQPHIKCIQIRDVKTAIDQLSEALAVGLPQKTLNPLSEDWPFVD